MICFYAFGEMSSYSNLQTIYIILLIDNILDLYYTMVVYSHFTKYGCVRFCDKLIIWVL